MPTLFLTKMPKTYNGKWTTSSTNTVEKWLSAAEN
jgi:hypothetical protein